MFQQFRSILRREFPHARFDGGVLSPGRLAETGAQLLSMGFIGSLIAMFAGEYVLPPPIAAMVSQNKGTTFVVGMAMNMCAGQLIATSAFEILVNGLPVHSKIQSGALPTVEHVIAAIRRLQDGRAVSE